MAKERRQYTREFKLEALHLWESSGKSAAQIERDLGLPDHPHFLGHRDAPRGLPASAGTGNRRNVWHTGSSINRTYVL